MFKKQQHWVILRKHKKIQKQKKTQNMLGLNIGIWGIKAAGSNNIEIKVLLYDTSLVLKWLKVM